MVIVIARGYVSEEAPYCNGFVHSRVKAYIKSGVETKVFVPSTTNKAYTYFYEDVEVIVGGRDKFVALVNKYDSVTVCVHFLDSCIIDYLKAGADRITKAIVFVHGYEALHWYQRIFAGTFANFTLFKNFISYIYNNIRELRIIRKFLKSNMIKCEFVTVSEWMRVQAENVWKCHGEFLWHIIPNYIDSEMFAYSEGSAMNMLSIRPFSSGKYANDITATFIKKFKELECFSKVKITWIGKGVLYKKTTKSLETIPNVVLENRMLQPREIYDYHKQNGVFICPTRQDAQGVSMCEAMSSGLVPITLYNTAIPEYLPDIKELACCNVDDMIVLARKLLEDEQWHRETAKACSEFIKEKCGYDNTIKREINLITQ